MCLCSRVREPTVLPVGIVSLFHQLAIIEATNLDWLGDKVLDFGTPKLLFNSSTAGPAANPIATPTRTASQGAERTEPLSGERDRPLLGLSDWERDKKYNKSNPEYIYYDFKWKISQRNKIRARQIFADLDPDVVLAPSDFWQVNLKVRLEGLLKDETKF